MSSSIAILSPSSSRECIKAEPTMVSSDYSEVEPRSCLKGCEDVEVKMEVKTERKSDYLMSREQEYMQNNIKEEEEDWEKVNVKLESEEGVRADENLLKTDEKERDEQERDVTDHLAQTQKLESNDMKSIYGQQVGKEPSLLVTSCLLKQPRVLIHRLEIINNSIFAPSPCCSVTCKRGQGGSFPRKQTELPSMRENGTMKQKKDQIFTWKLRTVGQSVTSLNRAPSSSDNGICTEVSLTSPLTPSRKQNTGRTAGVPCQVFTCTQCPFFHTEEKILQKHIEKIHPKELSETTRSQQPPSSPHQDPTPPTTLPIMTESHVDTPGAKPGSQCGNRFKTGLTLKTQEKTHERERPYRCSQCDKTFTAASKLKGKDNEKRGSFVYTCGTWLSELHLPLGMSASSSARFTLSFCVGWILPSGQIPTTGQIPCPTQLPCETQSLQGNV
ncbi:hypothetical protein GJAV_G00224020 [Gymnothorax javanicus]|nr:hypothetical protein GJAV_G00224020 [Gymnothorax javanicus]